MTDQVYTCTLNALWLCCKFDEEAESMIPSPISDVFGTSQQYIAFLLENSGMQFGSYVVSGNIDLCVGAITLITVSRVVPLIWRGPQHPEAGHTLTGYCRGGWLLHQKCMCSMSAALLSAQALQFEHRDMHRGNVLVKRTKEEFIYFRLNHKEYYIRSHGVRATIVDFTLSRITQRGIL